MRSRIGGAPGRHDIVVLREEDAYQARHSSQIMHSVIRKGRIRADMGRGLAVTGKCRGHGTALKDAYDYLLVGEVFIAGQGDGGDAWFLV
jgi:hypothetical protein